VPHLRTRQKTEQTFVILYYSFKFLESEKAGRTPL
jgi:hypothetical protein